MDIHSIKQRGRLQACDRCRLKKIRCDGLRPSCTNCRKVKFACVTSDTLKRRGFPKGYTEMLEKKIVELQQNNMMLHNSTHDRASEWKFAIEPKSAHNNGGGSNNIWIGNIICSTLNLNPEQHYTPQFLVTRYKRNWSHLHNFLTNFTHTVNETIFWLPQIHYSILLTNITPTAILQNCLILQLHFYCFDNSKLFQMIKLLPVLAEETLACCVWMIFFLMATNDSNKDELKEMFQLATLNINNRKSHVPAHLLEKFQLLRSLHCHSSPSQSTSPTGPLSRATSILTNPSHLYDPLWTPSPTIVDSSDGFIDLQLHLLQRTLLLNSKFELLSPGDKESLCFQILNIYNSILLSKEPYNQIHLTMLSPLPNEQLVTFAFQTVRYLLKNNNNKHLVDTLLPYCYKNFNSVKLFTDLKNEFHKTNDQLMFSFNNSQPHHQTTNSSNNNSTINLNMVPPILESISLTSINNFTVKNNTQNNNTSILDIGILTDEGYMEDDDETDSDEEAALEIPFKSKVLSHSSMLLPEKNYYSAMPNRNNDSSKGDVQSKIETAIKSDVSLVPTANNSLIRLVNYNSIASAKPKSSTSQFFEKILNENSNNNNNNTMPSTIVTPRSFTDLLLVQSQFSLTSYQQITDTSWKNDKLRSTTTTTPAASLAVPRLPITSVLSVDKLYEQI